MDTLNIVALPLNITWSDTEENLFRAERNLRKLAKDTDIVVLPELFSTGFIGTEELLPKLAEDFASSATLARVRKWARNFNFAIAGSVLIREGDSYFNRGFFIEPSGEETFYDKKHLFSISSEKRILSGGKSPVPVVRFRGWNIALAICYELRFPAWLRNTGYKYDVLIIPANWPESRAHAWQTLLAARAIENQAYVVGANRSGVDDGGVYDNQTFIFDYLGNPIHKGTDAAVTATVNRNPLMKFRKNFPAANDADSFVITND